MQKKGFTLAEMLIVAAIIGILAAIIIPEFRDHAQQAREAAAKDNLRILRNAIELYASQHNGVAPGYNNNDPQGVTTGAIFVAHLVMGEYIPEMPENPFNLLNSVDVINNNDPFPAAATGNFGWVYKPAERKIRLDWTGTDREGATFFEY